MGWRWVQTWMTERRVVPCFTFDILIAGCWRDLLPVWLRTNTIQFQMKSETPTRRTGDESRQKRKGREVSGAVLLLAGGSGLHLAASASDEQVDGVPSEKKQISFGWSDIKKQRRKKNWRCVCVPASVCLLFSSEERATPINPQTVAIRGPGRYHTNWIKPALTTCQYVPPSKPVFNTAGTRDTRTRERNQ